MDFGILKVGREGFVSDFKDLALGEEGSVEGELAMVGAEVDGSFGGEEFKRVLNERDVVHLDIEEGIHLFGAGDGRGVDHDEVVFVRGADFFREKFQTIGADNFVVMKREVVEGKIIAAPVAVGVGHIDTFSEGSPFGCGVDAKSARVGEKI